MEALRPERVGEVAATRIEAEREWQDACSLSLSFGKDSLLAVQGDLGLSCLSVRLLPYPPNPPKRLLAAAPPVDG